MVASILLVPGTRQQRQQWEDLLGLQKLLSSF